MYKSIRIVIFVLVAMSCSRGRRLKAYQDPFYDSFRKFNICKIISYDPKSPEMCHTITIGARGLSIRISGVASQERMEYDSLFFIKSKYEGPDLYNTYSVEYHFDAHRNLIQRWREKDSDTATTKTFIIGESGDVEMEIDSLAREYISYSYDNGGLLITKNRYKMESEELIDAWSFLYDKKHRLSTINLTGGGTSILTHYYSEGLLDSTVHHVRGYIVRHKLEVCHENI